MSNDEAFFFMSFPAVFYDDIYVKDSIKKKGSKVQGSLYICFLYIHFSNVFPEVPVLNNLFCLAIT